MFEVNFKHDFFFFSQILKVFGAQFRRQAWLSKGWTLRWLEVPAAQPATSSSLSTWPSSSPPRRQLPQSPSLSFSQRRKRRSTARRRPRPPSRPYHRPRRPQSPRHQHPPSQAKNRRRDCRLNKCFLQDIYITIKSMSKLDLPFVINAPLTLRSNKLEFFLA